MFYDNRMVNSWKVVGLVWNLRVSCNAKKTFLRNEKQFFGGIPSAESNLRVFSRHWHQAE
jgi:hypothetical protein